MSKFGELKYPAAFKQFDYVNAKAPKGGAASQIALGGFDNLNMVVAGVKGALAQGVDLLHDTLFVASLDEVASAYGLLANPSVTRTISPPQLTNCVHRRNGTTASR